MDIARFTELYLLYTVLPFWLAVGAADWLCHRAAGIERTSGPVESLIHLLMLAQIGAPLLLALFFEVNALLICVFVACWLAHELTSHWDLTFALRRRHVSAVEQHVHNYLGALPFMAFSLLLVLHWPQLLALVGVGPQEPDFALRLKHRPLPVAYVIALLGAILLLEVLPYIEELWRGLRHSRMKQAALRTAMGGEAIQAPMANVDTLLHVQRPHAADS
jgi:hypothetical protein